MTAERMVYGVLHRGQSLFKRFLEGVEGDAGELLETGAVYAENEVGGGAGDLFWADGVAPSCESVDDL